MGRRVGAAFAKYRIPSEQIAAFKRNVDEHGFPLFFQSLFPDAKMPVPKDLSPPTPGPEKLQALTPEKK